MCPNLTDKVLDCLRKQGIYDVLDFVSVDVENLAKNSEIISYKVSGGSKGGAPGPKILSISCSFFGKFWQNRRLVPPSGGLAPPPTGKPGSAPEGRSNSAIHKATGLTVPSCSMILPGIILEAPISREWSRQLEQPLGVVPTGKNAWPVAL